MRKTPAPKGTSSKKVKKRNPWSDNESKSDSELEESQPVIPRENKSQRASGQSNSAPTGRRQHCNSFIQVIFLRPDRRETLFYGA